jgi:1-acyl-sn-glycerol-3-phosphate acyltransferase
MTTNEKVLQICQNLDFLQEDTSVPRNIRRGADEAKKLLLDDKNWIAVDNVTDVNGGPNRPRDGKTGAARMAIDSGAPLIPAAVWGTQRILTKWRPRNLERGVAIDVHFGPPI